MAESGQNYPVLFAIYGQLGKIKCDSCKKEAAVCQENSDKSYPLEKK
jgi:hypothetical protein